MATSITTSDYIDSIDSLIVASLCDGKFHIDVSPSIFSSGGESYLEGASVQIVNPVGVTIKNYPTSGYDINPPFTDEVEYSIPLTAGNYQYGTYVITVRITDENGDDWVIEKSVNLCAPDKKNKNKKVGCLNATIKGNCNDGKVIVVLDTPPNYKGKTVESQDNDLSLCYPTESELVPLEFTVSSFSVQLYEGEYKVIGEVCATYNYGDNVYFDIKYEVKCSKIIKCSIDKCCVQAQLKELDLRLKSDCTAEEKENTEYIIFNTLRLLTSIDYAAFCGEDYSDYITELEELLGCTCTCNCNEGTPIINSDPVTDFVFEGCGFDVQTTGNTKTITLNNRAYTLELNDESGIFELSEPVDNEENCSRSQTLTVNVEALQSLVDDGSVVFKAVLNQTGTSAPVVSTNKNTTAVTWTPSYVGVGEYLLTASSSVMPDALKVSILSGYQLADSPMEVRWLNSTQLSIKSDTNGRLSNTALFVEIFP